jgi:[ribosomal protein S18]-alanine N-acetyltransferase
MSSEIEFRGIILCIRQVEYLFEMRDLPEVQSSVATINRQSRAVHPQVQQTRRSGEIVIAPANSGDIMGLRNLQNRCFQGGQAYGIVTLLVFQLWPKSKVLVAKRGEDIIGCVIGDVRKDQGRVLNICVDPEYRRRGLGSALLSTIEQILDHDNMTLMVEDKNFGAQELYRQHGYLSAGDLRDYYGRNRHGVLMQKRRVHPAVGYRPSLTITNGRDE